MSERLTKKERDKLRSDLMIISEGDWDAMTAEEEGLLRALDTIDALEAELAELAALARIHRRKLGISDAAFSDPEVVIDKLLGDLSRVDTLTTAIIAAVNWIDVPDDQDVSRSEVDQAVGILRGALKAGGRRRADGALSADGAGEIGETTRRAE